MPRFPGIFDYSHTSCKYTDMDYDVKVFDVYRFFIIGMMIVSLVRRWGCL